MSLKLAENQLFYWYNKHKLIFKVSLTFCHASIEASSPFCMLVLLECRISKNLSLQVAAKPFISGAGKC